jgi:hypothetical protein
MSPEMLILAIATLIIAAVMVHDILMDMRGR